MIIARLKAVGQWPSERHLLNTVVKNGQSSPADSLTSHVGIGSRGEVLVGDFEMRDNTSSE